MLAAGIQPGERCRPQILPDECGIDRAAAYGLERSAGRVRDLGVGGAGSELILP
jgi:hypothetical protein